MASEQNINDAISNAQAEGYAKGRYTSALSAIAIIATEALEAADSEIDDFAVKVMRAIAEAELA